MYFPGFPIFESHKLYRNVNILKYNKLFILAQLKTNVNAGEKFPSRIPKRNIKYSVIKQHELCAQQNPDYGNNVRLP